MENIDRNHPILATIQNRFPLTKKGSTKQTWHISLDVSDLDFHYQPGDSIGIYPKNDPILVDHLIQAMNAKPQDLIYLKRMEQQIPLVDFLASHANLSRITSSFLKLIYECEKCPQIEKLLKPENKPQLREFLAKNDPLFLIRDYATAKLPVQELCDQFGPLLPRFYSIASSKYFDPNILDLTVALFSWMQKDEKRYGVASHFLCHLAEVKKTPIPFFVQPARHFHLPQDPHTDIIMIGPGTGVAPFRAFMQERHHMGSQGNHWLFFGERNRNSDFFYESEWSSYQNLQIHTAFSRDQEEKTYVHHKMLEQGQKIYQWIEKGAHLYICGDAKAMSKDVEKTLQEIISKHGRKSLDEAKDLLKTLKKSSRFLLDVY